MGMLRSIVQSLRVYQWTKNLLVIAPLIFAKQLHIPGQVEHSLAAFIAFCLAASATYLFNDLRDIEKDRMHPEKRNRPLASGAISPLTAWILLAALLAAAMLIAVEIRQEFLYALLAYVALTVSYSLLLKHLIIIDVLTLALGFVLRAMAGAIALDVKYSNWLIVCTLFLAMFLALSKRRHEILVLDEGARNHRRVLLHYTVPYLDQLILVVAGGAVITYTIYTCSPEVIQRLHTDKLYMTLPLVIYGLFRYLFLVQNRDAGGDPSAMLLRDPGIAGVVVLWAAACGAIIYM